ncbi:MAG: hypothetical protein H6R22_865 [Chromatiaceae bacterium]|nr:hypothetical protein [Chromatiaceae bacterium]
MYTQHPQLLTQPPQAAPKPQDRERARRVRGVVTQMSLRDENVLFEATRGVSRNNRSSGFTPGYLNTATGERVPSRFADGSLAPVHLLDGLPESWVAGRNDDGHVTRTRPGIIAGFLRDGRFFTREEAARLAAH